MMGVDYEYYRNTFGGKRISAGEFGALTEEAGIILASLIYPKTAEKLSASGAEAFRRALCYEAEYLSATGTDRGISQNGIQSERIGDVAVAYRDPAETGAMQVDGITVSPAAVHLLRTAGVLGRWV